MVIENKRLTALVRSMRKALRQNHGVVVAHSALRASLLSALGEHPHAFGARIKGRDAWVVGASDHGVHTLHLAEDALGCLERLALDAAGRYLVPEQFRFTRDATLVGLRASVPAVRRYGLPEYVSSPDSFFAQRFSLSASAACDVEYEDTGDDSGDMCRLQVRMPADHWKALLRATLAGSGALREDVAEWVGLHHRRNFDAEPVDRKVDWVARYLEQHEGDANSRETVVVELEWVYPDEDGDRVEATVDTTTGVVRPAGPVPEDVGDPAVRVRVTCADGMTSFGVELHHTPHGAQWLVMPEDLAKLRKRVRESG